MTYWWWFWFAVLVFVILVPLGYGWGYRRWGPPYPSSYRRRRPPMSPTEEQETQRRLAIERDRQQQAVLGETASGWHWFADVMWLALLAFIVWGIVVWIV